MARVIGLMGESGSGKTTTFRQQRHFTLTVTKRALIGRAGGSSLMRKQKITGLLTVSVLSISY